MILLARHGPQGVMELADKLQLSHPLLIKLAARLEELGLVETSQDPRDGRRRPIRLTSKGEVEAQRVMDAANVLDRAYEDLFAEVGGDVMAIVSAIERACIHEDFSARLTRKAAEMCSEEAGECKQH